MNPRDVVSLVEPFALGVYCTRSPIANEKISFPSMTTLPFKAVLPTFATTERAF
jgi:hypothetical protein